MSQNNVQLNPDLNLLDRDTPFKWYSSTALFQPPLSEPCVHLSMHTALQTWDLVCLDRFSPYGSRPPAHGRGRSHSPAPLPRVSGITPIIWVLWVLRRHEPLGFLGDPAVPTASWFVRRHPLGGYPIHYGRLWRRHLPTSTEMIGNSISRFSPSLRGGSLSIPTRLGSTLSLALYDLAARLLENRWYLSPYSLQPCYRPLVPFGPRSGCALATSALVALDDPSKGAASTAAHLLSRCSIDLFSHSLAKPEMQEMAIVAKGWLQKMNT